MVAFMDTQTPAQFSKASYRLDFTCILLIYALDSFGIALVYPIFTPLLFENPNLFFSPDTSLALRTLLLGVLIGLFPIAQFFGVPFIGDFSDRSGRKKTFAITLLGSTFAYFLTAFSIFHPSFALLCLSRMISGFFAGNTSLCFACLSDMSPTDQERSKNFGLLAAFGALSFLVSILCGDYFFSKSQTSPLAISFPFFIIAALSFLIFLIMMIFFRDTKPPKKKCKFKLAQGYHNIVETLQNTKTKNAYLVYFFFSAGWIANMQFYPLNLIEVYHKEPLSFMINLLIVGAVWSSANFFVQRLLVKYLSPKEILWITTPALFFFLLSCLLSQSYLSFTIHFSCAVLMAALCWTNTFANVSLTAPKEIQGRIMGINQSFSAIAGLVGSLGGVAAASLHPSLIFLFGAICMIYSIHFLKKNNSQNT